jgi:hypothetical protein
MKTFKFKLADNTDKEMDIDEFTRWACLIEGLEYITKSAEQNNISLKDDSWIKPLAIHKYIEERFHSMKHDIGMEVALGNIS